MIGVAESIPKLEELDSNLLDDDSCSSLDFVLKYFGAGESVVADLRMACNVNLNVAQIGLWVL